MSLVEARSRIASARAITILTGAGISADSGVPTFRGADGLWHNFRAEDLATPEAFERDSRLVWEWYNWRREILATKRPNEAHHALVRLEERANNFHLITQNVDGLHRLAGSRNLSELHGDIWKVRCTSCRVVTDNREVPLALLPHCHTCGGLLRPHIVWFGEALDEQVLANSFQTVESCDVMIIVGTSGLVYPAAMLTPAAKANHAFVIEINLDPTPHSSVVSLSLQGRAKDIVPLLL
ncbi:MAG: NAD-dependent deacylase [Nitrospirota bacterium]|nr:NAD-dependent deacylase [Nitrospirota bacterium]MDP2384493.1 NAD-dependent deacylase [Nitrospirota bacterium]